MHLKAIHTIHRAIDGKQIVHTPGTDFECPDAEGKEYLALKAAIEIDAPELPLAAETPAKPAAAPKKASAKKAEAAKVEAPASTDTPATSEATAATDADGENADDMLD